MGEMKKGVSVYVLTALAILAVAYFVGMPLAIFLVVLYLVGRHYWVKHSVTVDYKNSEIHLEWDEFDAQGRAVRKKEIFNF